MTAHRNTIAQGAGYPAQLIQVYGNALVQLIRAPSHSHRTEAARRLARHSLWLSAAGAAVTIALMLTVDAVEIQMMPPRGTPWLWPVKILTDFGKDEYVLWTLGMALLILGAVAAGLQGRRRALWLGFGTRLQFLFLAVACSVLSGEALKYIVGRGRPFVGGKPDPFNFVPFDGTEAHFSMPSNHAATAFALAFAVSALLPRLRLPMYIYAVAIVLTRLVLLAHHPSDVIAGAVVGTVGAMAVRYWFAARGLGFAIRDDGAILPLPEAASRAVKRVAAGASGS